MTKEQKERMKELSKILEYTYCGTEEWTKAYNEYFELSAIEQEEYRAANEKKAADAIASAIIEASFKLI